MIDASDLEDIEIGDSLKTSIGRGKREWITVLEIPTLLPDEWFGVVYGKTKDEAEHNALVVAEILRSYGDLHTRTAALEAGLAACQAAPATAAGLTAADLALLYDTADVLNNDSSSARDVAMGIELQALAVRLEAAGSEAGDDR